MATKELFKRVMDSGNPAAIAALAKGDLENAAIAATPGGIEAQEAEGQRTLVSSGNRIPREGAEHVAKALKLKLGSIVDDLFVNVELPTGWQLLATDHPMWNKLVDADGKERASIFYKAAFYDRSAFIRLV